MRLRNSFALLTAAASLWPALAQSGSVPARPGLEKHTNYFDPPCIYDLQGGKPLDDGICAGDYPLKVGRRPQNLSYDAYSAVGYGLADSIMLVGPAKDPAGLRRVIIVDTMEDAGSARLVAAHYKRLYGARYTPSGQPPDKLPIDAIIYTHNHIDHTGGVLGYLAESDLPPCAQHDPTVTGFDGRYTARRSCVEIVGQEKVTESVINTSTVVGTILLDRSSYMYGNHIRDEVINDGIGPRIDTRGPSGFRIPSKTFHQEMELTAAGIHMKLVYVPSETEDELAAFVPDHLNRADRLPGFSDGWGGRGLLLSAEVIQGPSFPNLYSLRGTAYRNPAQWFRSVDRLLQFDSWCMIPSHGTPLCGEENIQLLLTHFRDAVQFTHDQTVRRFNQGQTPNYLADSIHLPAHIVEGLTKLDLWPNWIRGKDYVDPRDYLRFFYGSLKQSVRETYFGYLGWFDADPVNLDPVPPLEAARRTIELMGGADAVTKAAQAALDKGEAQWTAELATLLIRVSPDSKEYRSLKIQAFNILAAKALNPNWRNFYLTAAAELENVAGQCYNPFRPVGLIAPQIVTSVPLAAWLNSWTMRLDAAKSLELKPDQPMSMGFWFDTMTQDFGSRGYLIQVKRGIAVFSPFDGTRQELAKTALVTASMSQDTLDEILNAGTRDKAALLKAIAEKRIRLVGGTPEQAREFFGYFDDQPTCYPALTVPPSAAASAAMGGQ